MASVLDFVDAVNKRLAELMNPIVVTCHVGAEFIDRQESSPRVVWVPTEDDYRPGKRASGKAWATVLETQDPRSLMTVECGFAVHLWAEAAVGDTAEFKQLAGTLAFRDLFIKALRDCGFGSFSVTHGTWADRGGSGVTTKGRLYILSVQLEAPVAPDDGFQYATIATAQGTAEYKHPDGTTGDVTTITATE